MPYIYGDYREAEYTVDRIIRELVSRSVAENMPGWIITTLANPDRNVNEVMAAAIKMQEWFGMPPSVIRLIVTNTRHIRSNDDVERRVDRAVSKLYRG